jgi:NAD(P)-dependent dehydrogenase (short-subunit alcohol dehydrogenase family)
MLDLLIITGASKGIGESIVRKCAPICKTLIGISSTDKVNNIGYVNDKCITIPLKLDLSKYELTEMAINNLVSNMDLDAANGIGIVLCASQVGETGGLFNTNLEDWDKLYKCNVLGNLAIIKGCSKIIKSGVKTRIVFFTGGGAAFGFPEFSAYSLSKVATVRAVENMSMEFSSAGYDVSAIALSPGAVDTDMLAKVIAADSIPRTKTDISEPTNFVYNFLSDNFPSKTLDGKFLHVRDNILSTDFSTANADLFKLRRTQ